MSPARIAAFRAALQFEKNRTRLDILLGKENDLNARDQRFMRNLVSGSVRHLRYLDWIAQYLYRGNYAKVEHRLKVILRLALFEIIFMDSVPGPVSVNEYVTLTKKKSNPRASGMVNGILRNYLRRKDELVPNKLIDDPLEQIGIQYSFPNWMVRRWVEYWGFAETEKLCAALNIPPRFDLHINQTQISIDAFKQMLQDEGVAFEPSKYIPAMITVDDMQLVIQQGWLEDGLCSVQDESAAFPVQLLDPVTDDYVLDLCAAPGGKFQQILQNKPQLAVAVDSDIKRLQRVKENAQRLKLGPAFFVCADARQTPFKPVFSKILLDAPCSGLGVIRKHPDIKWRRTAHEIGEFARLQQAILQNAMTLLHKGGRLAYSTCTIDQQENERVAATFTESIQDLAKPLIPQSGLGEFEQNGHFRTLPQRHHMDGSFCTLFQKNS